MDLLKEQQQQKQNKKEYKCNLQCNYGKLSDYFCIDLSCKEKNKFVCNDRACQCRKQHKQCQKSDVLYVYEGIKRQLENSDILKKQIQSLFDKLIDELSQARDKILSLIDENMKSVSLLNIQQQFLEAYSTSTSQLKFNDQSLVKLWLITKSQKKRSVFDIHSITKRQLQTYFQKSIQLKNNLLENINNNKKSKGFQIQKKQFQKHIQQQILEIKQIFQSFSQKIEDKQYTKSNILKSQELYKKFQKQFKLQIKKAKLIFKASENNFSLKKYFELCGNETQTVIICKTNKGKILGAYSPLCHYTGQQGETKDASLSSFIFSLDENIRFDIKKDKYAIYRFSDKKYIRFGADQFVIGNNSNDGLSDTKCFIFNNMQCYQNVKYTNKSEIWLKLTGSQKSMGWTTQQWQVWKLKFQNS